MSQAVRKTRAKNGVYYFFNAVGKRVPRPSDPDSVPETKKVRPLTATKSDTYDYEEPPEDNIETGDIQESLTKSDIKSLCKKDAQSDLIMTINSMASMLGLPKMLIYANQHPSHQTLEERLKTLIEKGGKMIVVAE